MIETVARWQNQFRYHLWHFRARLHTFKGALILSYHSISNGALDPLGLHVSPQNFAEHLQVLKSYFEPVPLSEILRYLRNQKSLYPLVALTFDDGYANNLWTALPLLEKYQVPATIFVISGAVESNIPFYWEILAQKLLDPTASDLPAYLQVRYRGQLFRYSLRTSAQRLRAYHGLRRALTDLWGEERSWFLGEILQVLGGERVPSHTIRPLTIAELQQLARSPLITIGNHTVSHPRLDRLTPAQAWQEIREARRQLSEWIGQEVRYFAYPYGYERMSLRYTVREAGHEAACGTKAGGVSVRSNPFALPRLHAGNWSGEHLARYLGK